MTQKQKITKQKQADIVAEYANFYSVRHSGTTFWAQILKPLCEARYIGFTSQHIERRHPNPPAGPVIVCVRHPLSVAISWKNRNAFSKGWNDRLTESWRILCHMIPQADYVLSVDSPDRDKLLNKFLSDHDLRFKVDWSIRANRLDTDSDLHKAFAEGDLDRVFSEISQQQYKRMFSFTEPVFSGYELYVSPDREN